MNRLHVVTLSDVEPAPIAWLWPGRIPRGKLTMLCGDPGLGKSFITIDLAARVTTGRGWPDAPDHRDLPGDVLILSAEDDETDTIRPRLDAAGGDASRVQVVKGLVTPARTVGVALDEDVHTIRAHVQAMPRPLLVVIDPISAYMGRADAHSNAEVRGILAQLAQLAMDTGVAVLCVSHLSKNQGVKAVYRQMGSLAFTAAARLVWQVAKLPGSAPDDPTRALVLVKSNLKAQPLGMTFRVEDGRVRWLSSDLTLDADTIENEEAAQASEAVPEAAEFLRSLLSAGPLAASEVIQQAEQAAISVAALKRAKKRAGVVARRAPGSAPQRPWVWSLEAHALPQDVSL